MTLKTNKIMALILLLFLMCSTTSNAVNIQANKTENINEENPIEPKYIIQPQIEDAVDFDPLTNIKLNFTLKEIRAFDKIDLVSEADFYVKVTINDKVSQSKVWQNKNYVKNPEWSVIVDVPDYEPYVDIKIQLFDKDVGKDKLCDISRDFDILDEGKDVELTYSVLTGHWFGDDCVQYYQDWDARGDPSGYGRLNGCDDNSIYSRDLDCELWFDITQNDFDHDGIPYWSEVNVFNTDPKICNLGEDDDLDNVPIEWEFKWGYYYYYDRHDDTFYETFFYDPFTWENHSSFDFDQDGLDNVEEYLASSEGFRTDPYRRDILLEIDQMKYGPNGEGAIIPELSKDLIWDAFGKHNIVFEIDDQGQQIPFDCNTSGWNGPELQNIYNEYFLNGDLNYWRRGAFHYAPIVYKCDNHPGNMYNSFVGDWDRTYNFSENNNNNVSIYGDCFQVSTRNHEKLPYRYRLIYIVAHKTLNIEKTRAIVYASAMMHETGHVLGIYRDNVPGCDDRNSVYPWDKEWWIWRSYKSIMNYGWMYQFVDYSDGSRGKNDFDDWSNIDLTLFQLEKNPYFTGFN